MSREFTPDMLRRQETCVSLCNLLLKLRWIRTASLSSGGIVPRVTIAKVKPFIPRERSNVKHSIADYLRLPQSTPFPALMRVLHWLC